VHSPKFCKFHSRLNMPCTQKSEHFQGLGKKADLDSPPHQSSPHHEWQCMTTIGPEFFFLSMHEIFPTFQTHVNLGPNTGPPLNPLRVGRHVNMVGSDAFEVPRKCATFSIRMTNTLLNSLIPMQQLNPSTVRHFPP
jgi:hypothetical protein